MDGSEASSGPPGAVRFSVQKRGPPVAGLLHAGSATPNVSRLSSPTLTPRE